MDTSGRLWVTTRKPGGIARFDPAHPRASWRHFTGPEFTAPDGDTIGPDGAIWAVDSERGSVLRVQPTMGIVDEWAGDLSINAPFDLKPGPDGTLWFTNRGADTIGGSASPDRRSVRGRYSEPASGCCDADAFPEHAPRPRLYGTAYVPLTCTRRTGRRGKLRPGRRQAVKCHRFVVNFAS